MPGIKLRGKLAHVSLKVRRPKSKAGVEKLRLAMEKVVRKHGGKIKKRK